MPSLSRDELASRYLEQLPYSPYPVQEDALLVRDQDHPHSAAGLLLLADPVPLDPELRRAPVAMLGIIDIYLELRAGRRGIRRVVRHCKR